MSKKKMSFEEQMDRLEEILDILDAGNVPLEEMLDVYEEGMKLASEMREFLEKAEQKVIEVSSKKKVTDETF
ncbi:MAG: exodeoxyribonuclease VII small subunit [bacterium]